MFHYTVETEKSMEKAIHALEENLKEEKFGVLWQFDVKETLNNKGFDFEQAYQVLEVCNPKEANNVLSQNQLIGYFLLCKMVVYQDIETNKVKIGMPKPTALIEMVHDASLQKFAADIEERLIVCIDKTK